MSKPPDKSGKKRTIIHHTCFYPWKFIWVFKVNARVKFENFMSCLLLSYPRVALIYSTHPSLPSGFVDGFIWSRCSWNYYRIRKSRSQRLAHHKWPWTKTNWEKYLLCERWQIYKKIRFLGGNVFIIVVIVKKFCFFYWQHTIQIIFIASGWQVKVRGFTHLSQILSLSSFILVPLLIVKHIWINIGVLF